MVDTYHLPALILTALLLPAFVDLYFRFRDTRTLLWLAGFCCSFLATILLYASPHYDLSGIAIPWMAAFGETIMLIGSALFMASLSPITFQIGRLKILYAIPFFAPLLVYSALYFLVWRGTQPQYPWYPIFPLLGLLSLAVAVPWAWKQRCMSPHLCVVICLALGTATFWGLFTFGVGWALNFAQAANFAMTAVMLIAEYRRPSPGVFLSVLGFLAWALIPSQAFPFVYKNPALHLDITDVISMGQVIAAIGMILITLENQVTLNRAAQERERRARRELEAYTRLILARRRVEDFDRQGNEICATIAAHSRFQQVALLLYSDGRYRLAGSDGLEAPVTKALDELAARLPATGFLEQGSMPSAIGNSQTLLLNFERWLWPGDDLKRLGFTTVLAVPMVNRSETEGVLVLSGIRPIAEPGSDAAPDALRSDDLLPIEMLVARLQATRSQTMLFEKLVDSEKFGHLGQLASNVTHQLNNPLTVVLGYASLLEATAALDPDDRKAIESILTESRRMRTTLDSLTRITRQQNDQLAAVSVAELLSDLGELHRQDFLQRSIEFRLSLAPNLPRALCSAPQLRQAVRHCLQFAMEAVESAGGSPDGPKAVRLEAASEGNFVQIMIAHSGPAFESPDRAFDPITAPQPIGQTSGLGLSLCATVMRDNNGRASAVNLEPRGAAIVLELKAA